MASVNLDSSQFLPKGVKLQATCSDPTLLRMLEEGLLADITLTAKGGSVKAHRSVLAGVSPVFCAMFQHNMKETLMSQVDLIDMTVDALKLFLLLLYTTNEEDKRPERMRSQFINAMGEYFFEIVEATQKYQAGRRLGRVLWLALRGNLKLENCWRYLEYSKEIGESKSNGAYIQSFYEICFDYIQENYDEVVKSESFLQEMRRNPALVYSMILAKSQGEVSGTAVYMKRSRFEPNEEVDGWKFHSAEIPWDACSSLH